jgi:hypothetical protein
MNGTDPVSYEDRELIAALVGALGDFRCRAMLAH